MSSAMDAVGSLWDAVGQVWDALRRVWDMNILQGHPSPVHVHHHLCPPDGKWKPPPSGATFGEDSDAASDCTEGSAEQIVNPRAHEGQGPVRGNKKLYWPVRGKGTDKKKVARPVGDKGTGKKNVARAVGGNNGTAAGKKKAGP